MSSHEVLALVTDALRGQLASALPPGTQVIVRAPSPDAPAREGLFVHLLRIALAKARRNEVMERRVRIGVTEMTAMTWLPRLVNLIQRYYPKVIIEPDVDTSVQLRDKMP
mgnify:CR=1 FL=1